MQSRHQRETTGGAASVRLTPEELQEVMNDAIARHGEAQRAAERASTTGSLSTLDDALQVARDLNIPEEHVRAAVEERQRAHMRERGRQSARARLRRSLFGALGAAAGLGVYGLWGGGPAALAVAAIAGLTALYFAARLLAGVGDREADRAETLPVAGTCRVCGAPAYNERATFCDTHRYKGPTG